jgi:hypothetical protein
MLSLMPLLLFVLVHNLSVDPHAVCPVPSTPSRSSCATYLWVREGYGDSHTGRPQR